MCHSLSPSVPECHNVFSDRPRSLPSALMSHMHTNAADSAGSSPEIYFPVLHSENVAYMLLQNLIWACQHVSRRKPISNEDEQLINELIETKLLYWYQALRLLASSETGNRCLWSLSWSQCYGQPGPTICIVTHLMHNCKKNVY